MGKTQNAVRPIDWIAVDWHRKNTEIADELGVSDELVRRRRNCLIRPLSPEIQSERLGWLRAWSNTIHSVPLTKADVAAAIGCSTVYLKDLAMQIGLSWTRTKVPVDRVDWRLPSQDLERIWPFGRNWATNLRRKLKLPSPHWDTRLLPARTSTDYLVALSSEEGKATEWANAKKRTLTIMGRTWNRFRGRTNHKEHP